MAINWAEKRIDEIILYFSTNPADGLSTPQADYHFSHYGRNNIDSFMFNPGSVRGLSQKTRDFRAILSRSVGITAVIYVITVVLLSLFETQKYTALPVIILVLGCLLVFFTGVYSEGRFGEIYKLSRPRATVIRDGKRKRIFTDLIVPGDLILFKTGDFIPADTRLIEANSLVMFENFDGKPLHVAKNARSLSPAAEVNTVFAGSIVTSGNGKGFVVATGSGAKISRTGTRNINDPDLDGENMSVLQRDAVAQSRRMTLNIMLFAVFHIITGITLSRDIISTLSVALAVAASTCFEWLPQIVDCSVIFGLYSQVDKGLLIKTPKNLDALNSLDTLIADKLDSFTNNSIILSRIYFNHWEYDIKPENVPSIGKIISYMAICCDVVGVDNDGNVTGGGAVDSAVYKALVSCGITKEANDSIYLLLEKSARNTKTGFKTALIYQNRQFVVVCIGDAMSIVDRCSYRSIGADKIAFDKSGVIAYKNKIVELYKKYDHVMGVAVKTYKYDNLSNINEAESGLELLAMVSFVEPSRSPVVQSIGMCRRAGINLVMLASSDSVSTSALAEKIGLTEISEDGSSAVNMIDSRQIDSMDEGVFYSTADKYNIFTSMDTKHRIKLISALKFRKKTVGITVNRLDDLAVTETADMTVTNVATDTGILMNKASVIIHNVSIFSLTSMFKAAAVIKKNALNISAIALISFISQYLISFFPVLAGGTYIFNPAMILWSGTATVLLSSLAMCMKKESLTWVKDRLNKQRISDFRNRFFIALFIAALTIAVFLIGVLYTTASGGASFGMTEVTATFIDNAKNTRASTLAFMFYTFALCFYILSNNMSGFFLGLDIVKNIPLGFSIAFNILTLFIFMYVPVFSDIFGLYPLPAGDVITSVGFALFFVLPFEIYKKLRSYLSSQR